MISIIIPTYNEQDTITSLVRYLLSNSPKEAIEIIIIDGGSTDETLAEVRKAGVVALLSPKKGRAAQMNYGATVAKGNVLYFIHADTLPPTSFIDDINDSITEGYDLGRYYTKYDTNKIILKVNAFFTRFDFFICYGGDQTLFIKTAVFNSIGGFDETMQIMEDYEIVTRARKNAKYKIIQKGALVSARKYDTNSWLTVQKANYTIVQLYKNGASQSEMSARYKKMLQYR